jgi:hypothetical protein
MSAVIYSGRVSIVLIPHEVSHEIWCSTCCSYVAGFDYVGGIWNARVTASGRRCWHLKRVRQCVTEKVVLTCLDTSCGIKSFIVFAGTYHSSVQTEVLLSQGYLTSELHRVA